MSALEPRVWVKAGLSWPITTDPVGRDRDVREAELGLRARACQDTENTGTADERTAWITQLPAWRQR